MLLLLECGEEIDLLSCVCVTEIAFLTLLF